MELACSPSSLYLFACIQKLNSVPVPDVLRAEHFLPYFASQGYDAYALSLRGTSKSPDPSGAVGTQASICVLLSSHEKLAFSWADWEPWSGHRGIIIIQHEI